MVKRLHHRAIIAAGAVLLIGIALGLRLGADPTDPDAPPPPVVAAPAALLPDDFPRKDVEMFGQLLSVWDDQGARIVQYRGDFQLHFDRRRMSADNAVVWVRTEPAEHLTLKKFTVYLEGNVRIVDLGGTTLRDDRHLVQFETTGRIWTDANTRGEPAGEDQALYRRGRVFRDQVAAGLQRGARLEDDETVPAAPVRPSAGIHIQADSLGSPVVEGDQRVVLAQGNVFITRSPPEGVLERKLFIEMRADRAVLFARESRLQEGVSGSGAATRPDWQDMIVGVYLQGAVELKRGERWLKGSELFYDFEHDRALVLDALMYQRHESREVPLMLHARQIRQLSAGETVARDAVVTTSEMNTPLFDLRAREVRLTDEAIWDDQDDADRRAAMRYQARHSTFRVRGVPVSYWPASSGRFEQRETALRRLNLGIDSKFGGFVRAQWHLFELLNLEEPEGLDAYLNTNYYLDRGPEVGVEGKYTRDNFYGYFIANMILDRKREEWVGPHGEEEEEEDADERYRARGRVLARHRHYLRHGWELTGEFSYLSDRTYLREWYRKEFDVGKEQETLLYLKKAQDNWAFTALAKVRINDFLNQAEKFPELKFYKLGEPLWNDRLVYYTENSLGLLNYAADDERTDRSSSGALLRADTRHEVQVPLRNGPFQIVPYITLRGTAWTKGSRASDRDLTASEEEDGSGTSGGAGRVFGAVGTNISTMFSRTFNHVESRFWDLHRMRHLIKPELNLHIAASSVDRDRLLGLDRGNESVVGASAISAAVRQRLQTKRGGPGAWRSVDWMILDIEATLFVNDPSRHNFEPEFTRPPAVRENAWNEVFARGEFFNYRPENSLARSTINWFYQWRISDTMTLLSRGNIGEGGLDRTNFGFSVQRSPRWRMYFGLDYIAALDSNQLLFQTAYKLNRKYDLLFSYAFDTIRGETASTQVTVVRKIQRFYVALTFDVSNTEDRRTVMISLWPEGAPEMRLGQTFQSPIGATATATRRD